MLSPFAMHRKIWQCKALHQIFPSIFFPVRFSFFILFLRFKEVGRRKDISDCSLFFFVLLSFQLRGDAKWGDVSLKALPGGIFSSQLVLFYFPPILHSLLPCRIGHGQLNTVLPQTVKPGPLWERSILFRER